VPEIAWMRRAQREAINLLLLSRPTRAVLGSLEKSVGAKILPACNHCLSISVAGHQHLTLAVAIAYNADKGRSMNPMTTSCFNTRHDPI